MNALPTTALQPTARWGATVLRIALGLLFLAHAAIKLFVFTPAGTAAFFQSLGLPGPLAYLTIAAEVAIGLAMVLGMYARWFALPGIVLLLGTIVTVHGHNGFAFNSQGGGWEYPAFWALALAVQWLLGDGALTLRSR